MFLSSQKLQNIIKNGVRNCSNCAKQQNHQQITTTRKITQNDLNEFSVLCGDCNPLHSENVLEDDRYVHGAFLNSLVSGIMGSKLPGPGTIVVSQKYKFPRKCKVNQDIEFTVKLVENRKIMKVLYHAKQNQQIVFQGEANLIRSRLIETS